MDYSIEVAGVNSLLIRFSDRADPQLITVIGRCCELIKQYLNNCLIDVVPSYTTIMVTYDLLRGEDEMVRNALELAVSQLDSNSVLSSQARRETVLLPVCYDDRFAPDLTLLSDTLALDRDEIIRLHSERVYQVFAVGFSPGFGYLGELDPKLRVPRFSTPRTSVPAGSVAIAELNTAVYPQSTPGGWWLIGRCPIPMFDKLRADPCLFQVGDQVQFQPITVDEFHCLKGE